VSEIGVAVRNSIPPPQWISFHDKRFDLRLVFAPPFAKTLTGPQDLRASTIFSSRMKRFSSFAPLSRTIRLVLETCRHEPPCPPACGHRLSHVGVFSPTLLKSTFPRLSENMSGVPHVPIPLKSIYPMPRMTCLRLTTAPPSITYLVRSWLVQYSPFGWACDCRFPFSSVPWLDFFFRFRIHFPFPGAALLFDRGHGGSIVESSLIRHFFTAAEPSPGCFLSWRRPSVVVVRVFLPATNRSSSLVKHGTIDSFLFFHLPASPSLGQNTFSFQCVILKREFGLFQPSQPKTVPPDRSIFSGNLFPLPPPPPPPPHAVCVNTRDAFRH